MSSTYEPYNKREFVTASNGKTIERENACFGLVQHPEKKDVLLASDRAYKVMPDGSLRSMKMKKMKRGGRKI